MTGPESASPHGSDRPVVEPTGPRPTRAILDVTIDMAETFAHPDATHASSYSEPAPRDDDTPPPAWLDLGFHIDDLRLWRAAFLTRPVHGEANPEIAWAILGNYMTRIGDLNPDLSQHDALAWLIVDPDRVTDLAGGGVLTAEWSDHTPHGWLPHAAGLSPREYAEARPPEEDLRLLASLRYSFALPPLRPGVHPDLDG